MPQFPGFRNALLGLGLALCIPSLTTATPQGDAPAILKSSGDDYKEPIWVSGEAFAKTGTEPDWSLLGVNTRSSVETLLDLQKDQSRIRREKASGSRTELKKEVAAAECSSSVVTSGPSSGNAPTESFLDLLRHSTGIYSGKVTGVTPGFFLGAPASLLRVEVDRVFKEGSAYQGTTELYVYHPFARFALGPYVFCSGANDHVFEPEIGGKVLLFVDGPPLDKEGLLVTPKREQIFYESAEGKLVLPERLRTDDELFPTRSLREIEKLVGRGLKQAHDSRNASPRAPRGNP